MDKEMMNKINERMKVSGTRELSLDEMDKVIGGASFWFFDDERRKPKDNTKPKNQSNDE